VFGGRKGFLHHLSVMIAGNKDLQVANYQNVTDLNPVFKNLSANTL
jgi:hypothetical protein